MAVVQFVIVEVITKYIAKGKCVAMSVEVAVTVAVNWRRWRSKVT
jgi:hypothetical protein